MPDAEREFLGSSQVAALALAVLIGECGIVEGWMVHALSGATALAVHFSIAIGLAIWSRWSSVAHVDLRLPLLLTVTVAGLGPIGAAGTLLTIVLCPWYARDAVPFEEWYQALFPE
jgi:polysaccharide biosynthesis protein PelE